MSLSPSSRYVNRELSWLEFNQRVLDEARDDSVPLLDRLKFVAITASNLDEFFMVRVGGLQTLVEQGGGQADPSGLTPEQQLQMVMEKTQQIVSDQYQCYQETLERGLAEAGLRRLRKQDLTERQAAVLEQIFDNEIYTVYTPMAVPAGAEFPLLTNLTLNLCVRLKPAAEGGDTPRFAVIPLGRSSQRFISLPADGGNYAYMLLEDVVEMYVDRFFPGEAVVECVPFRITRNADLSLREDQAPDLLAKMQEVLDARRESSCVRLETSTAATARMRTFLQRALRIKPLYVQLSPGPLDLSAFMRLADLQGFDLLRYEPWPPRPSPQVDPASSMFEILSRGDVLLHHPYESFEPILRLIESAADDPNVLAIKQTLYRTSRESPIVAALMRAARNGKAVAVVVELKARFDEARNIEWAKNLEQAGVQVIYGVKGLKTHAKLLVIVRREPKGIQRYVHFGTGNYNENTARLYSDISLLTSHEELAADATSFFNAITGYSQPQKFRKIAAAPIGLREQLLEMIQSETERKRQGQKARIVIKLNSLVDPQLIDALYEASAAGVKVRLIIRGICCLRPGVPKLSENISVISIVDRFLEHSRILHFHHGGDERVFISSADWMPRNLDRRVELLVPVEDPISKQRLIEILEIQWHDTVKARRLNSDGSYSRVEPSGKKPSCRSQSVLYQLAEDAIQQLRQSKRAIFEPYRAPGSDD